MPAISDRELRLLVDSSFRFDICCGVSSVFSIFLAFISSIDLSLFNIDLFRSMDLISFIDLRAFSPVQFFFHHCNAFGTFPSQSLDIADMPLGGTNPSSIDSLDNINGVCSVGYHAYQTRGFLFAFSISDLLCSFLKTNLVFPLRNTSKKSVFCAPISYVPLSLIMNLDGRSFVAPASPADSSPDIFNISFGCLDFICARTFSFLG